jgi:hypothetical protein
MEPIEGKSISNLIFSEQSGVIDSSRDHVLIGKERHDVGRPFDWGYPIRGIINGEYLFIQNFEPTRWPAGDPVTGYLNCDGSPTKTLILEENDRSYWNWSFGKRQELELYNIKTDPLCLSNLATETNYSEILVQLQNQLYQELKQQGDPRMSGNGHLFDEYKYADPTGVNFYERYLKGEKLAAGWVNESDFEKTP